MSTQITITLQGVPQLRSQLQRAIDGLAKPRPLMDAIGQVIKSQTALRIDEFKADPSGKPWADIKPSTQAAYARKYKGKIPGSLLNRNTSGNSLRTTLDYNLIGDDAVEVGFGVPYAIFHEFGTVKMARRGLLTANPETGTLGDDDLAEIDATVQLFIDQLL